MSTRRVVAYWHDDEGTLVAACDDGTLFKQEPVSSRGWEPEWPFPIPQPPIGAPGHRPAPGTILDYLHSYVYGSMGPDVSDQLLCKWAEKLEAMRRINSAT